MHFNSLEELAHHLTAVAVPALQRQMTEVLGEIGQKVEKRAHDKVGVYQPATAQYQAWAPLADSTLERKARAGQGKGGNPDTPMYATGDFDRDISHTVNASEGSVEIGSNKPYIVFTEFGTSNMPPRAVFGPSAIEVVPGMLPRIEQLAASAIGTGVMVVLPG